MDWIKSIIDRICSGMVGIRHLDVWLNRHLTQAEKALAKVFLKG